ncbi:MAG: YkgJ family cysteine cluster protein, partial [Myxococcota bacterium]
MHAYLLGGRPIHFPFPSGLLDYECETCDAPCCRGAELGIGRSRELVTLERVLPRASLFARPGFAGGSMLSVSSPLEACWFLDRKDRCRLHKVGGPEAKPAGCRLFPFHRVRSLGEAVVVLPDFTCPLAVCPPDRSSPRSLHDELALEMHRAGVPRGGHKALPPPQDMDWEQALLLERRVVLATPHHLEDTDYLPYCDVQQALALEALGLDGARATLAPVRQSMERLLGSCARPSPGLVRELVALTGILRLCVSTVARREVPALLLAL